MLTSHPTEATSTEFGLINGKKKRQNSEQLAKRVYHFYKNVCNEDKQETVKHFVMEEGESKNTIYGIIRRADAGQEPNFKNSPGRLAKQSSLQNQKLIMEELQKNPKITAQELSEKLNIPRPTINFIRLKKLGIRVLTRLKKT